MARTRRIFDAESKAKVVSESVCEMNPQQSLIAGLEHLSISNGLTERFVKKLWMLICLIIWRGSRGHRTPAEKIQHDSSERDITRLVTLPIQNA